MVAERLSQEIDVLIIGGGFAGLTCFRAIDRKRRSVKLLTDRNHFLFTPLLPLAAAGTVEVRSIVEPIRSFQRSPAEILVGEALDILPAENKIFVRWESGDSGYLQYRDLVIACGAMTATYGIPGVKEHCLFLKEMKDARRLREKILFQFEKAAHETESERKKSIRFVVVGGGATGIETACEIDDLIRHDLKKDFPELMPHARIEIIEASKDILPSFDRTLAEYAKAKLRQKNIILRTELAVKEVRPNLLLLSNGEWLEAETLLWTAGNAPVPFIQKIAERVNQPLARGRIAVDDQLRVKGQKSLYAIGDCSVAMDRKGRPVPATGQVAMKQGDFLGRRLSSRKQFLFNFKTMGMLASLGSDAAIADLGKFRFKGWLASLFWKAVYLTRLVSLRNKASVAFDWIKVRFFGRNTARIDF